MLNVMTISNSSSSGNNDDDSEYSYDDNDNNINNNSRCTHLSVFMCVKYGTQIEVTLSENATPVWGLSPKH